MYCNLLAQDALDSPAIKVWEYSVLPQLPFFRRTLDWKKQQKASNVPSKAPTKVIFRLKTLKILVQYKVSVATCFSFRKCDVVL